MSLSSVGCPPGTFGDNCQQSCDCEGESSCHPATGKCLCPPGRAGTRCETGMTNKQKSRGTQGSTDALIWKWHSIKEDCPAMLPSVFSLSNRHLKQLHHRPSTPIPCLTQFLAETRWIDGDSENPLEQKVEYLGSILKIQEPILSLGIDIHTLFSFPPTERMT